jgi:uncharacterized protein (TIGR02598 family)
MRPHSRARCGFTILEVALALAVFAIAVLALIALIPVGQSKLHSAMDRTVVAQIGRQLISEYNNDGLVGNEGDTRYFTLTGREVPQKDEDGYYVAHTTIQPGALLPAGKEGRVEAGIATLKVEVTVLGRANCETITFPFVKGELAR